MIRTKRRYLICRKAVLSALRALAFIAHCFSGSKVFIFYFIGIRVYVFSPTIKNAPEEQQTLMIEVELLRQLTAQIAGRSTLLSVPVVAGSASAAAHIQPPATPQLRWCFQLLHDLDTIAVKYIGNNTLLQTPGAGKEHRSRLFRWGLYKRKEFVGLLGDLRNMICLLHTLQQSGNRSLEQPLRVPDAVSYVELTDALDRPWVCSFEHCNTYKVSCSEQ